MNSFTAIKSILLLLLLTILGICTLKAQSEAILNGHIAFGEERYDDAITQYNLAITQGSTWSWLPEIIETVEKRKLLGSIIPKDTHFIGAIFVTERNIIKDTGGVEKLVDVTPEQKEKWHIIFNLTKQVIQSFSDGNWSLEFDTISAISTYTENAELMPDNPDHLNLETYFFNELYRFDSYITFSNTRSPARGLARSYPVINGVLYGPSRGMAAINAGTHGFSTLLHEFFHVIEWVSNAIKITHGYRTNERDSFPDWTGNTEYDYYRWQFSDTLAEVGWEKLNHRLRWIPFKWKYNEFQNIKNAYSTIPLEDRRRANVLYDSARAMKGDSLELAINLFEQVIGISPYHENALIELKEYYELVQIDYGKVVKHLLKLQQIRRVNDYYYVYDETKDLGDVIALWHREDMSEQGKFFEWDVTNKLDSTGDYQVTFYYTHGWKGVEIDSLFLLENEFPFNSDIHKGWSGKTKTDNVYNLLSFHKNDGQQYLIRVKLTSKGGTDSWGQVHFKYLGDLILIPESKNRIPLKLYPNPVEDYLRINSESIIENLVVYNITGQEIMVERNIHDKIFEKDVSSWSSGLYILRISTQTETYTYELLKK